jgi:hypothetical protein
MKLPSKFTNEYEIWQHCAFYEYNTDWCLPAQFTPSSLSMKLLQLLLPCWLQQLHTWSIMSACIPGREKPILTSSVAQLSPHLPRHALAKFCFMGKLLHDL